MPKTTIIKFLTLTIILTAALSVNYLFAAWTGPTQAPPGGNTPAPINVGSTNQVKDGGLSLDALSVFGGGYFQGNVGIGVVSPTQNLEVAGKIKIGNDSTSPDAGTIRWTGSDFEGYDGSAWTSLTGGETTAPPSNGCPSGQEPVDFGGASICLADGAIASASCSDTQGYYNETFSVSTNARYTSGQVQTKVSGTFSGSANCDSGWVTGLSASCNWGGNGYYTNGSYLNVSAQTSSNGVRGSGSGRRGDTVDQYGQRVVLKFNCSVLTGAW